MDKKMKKRTTIQLKHTRSKLKFSEFARSSNLIFWPSRLIDPPFDEPKSSKH